MLDLILAICVFAIPMIAIGLIVDAIRSKLTSKSRANRNTTHKTANDSKAKFYAENAEAKMNKKDYSGAIEDYSTALSYEKVDVYYNNRGYCKSQTNNYSGALEDYNKAVELSPKYSLYWFNRGMLHYNNENDKDAKINFEKASDLGNQEATDFIRKNFNNTEFKNNDITNSNVWKDFALSDEIYRDNVNNDGIDYSLSEYYDSYFLNDGLEDFDFIDEIDHNIIRDDLGESHSIYKTNENGRNENSYNRRFISSQKKSDWLEFKKTIDRYHIKKLYHFTDKSNLDSIKKHGALLSWSYCLRKKIRIPCAGGDSLSRSLDSRRGVQNYVRVCFTKNHPMMHLAKNQDRILNPVLLEIDPEVIFLETTKFSNMNATRNDANIGDTLVDFKKIKFRHVIEENHFDLEEDDRPFYQAEVLVFERIPLSYIMNINQI